MQNGIKLLAVFVVTTLQGCGYYYAIKGHTYPLPNSELEGKNICGYKSCIPSNDGKAFHMIHKPYSPPADKNSTIIDLAATVLGRMPKSESGGTPFNCSLTNSNPFKNDDFVMLGNEGGRSIETNIIEVNSQTFTGAMNATKSSLIDKLTKTKVNREDLKKANEIIDAFIGRASGKNVTLKGRYYEVGLKPDIYRAIFTRNDAYQDCVGAISNRNNSIITAVGIIHYDIDYTGVDIDSFNLELITLLSNLPFNFDLKATLRSEVNGATSATTRNGVQIISWTLADKTHFNDTKSKDI